MDNSLARPGGFTQVPNAILRNPALSYSARILYILLLSYAWQDPTCYPGQTRMAHDLGVSRQWIGRYMVELETAGLVAIERRGQGYTNIYTLLQRVMPLYAILNIPPAENDASAHPAAAPAE